jgi:hypothetical protein
MALIDLTRPAVVVELGTHNGVSYCAFLQAIAELGLPTRAYAIDTWEGDAQAGYYGGEVLADLQAHHDERYSGFSRLIKARFDQALQHFERGSIDLLHIDGFHTYEAVKHDFESWLPKMSESGVIVFHDTNCRERDFGVWRLWKELSPRFPHFEFVHGHGLGVLAVGPHLPSRLRSLLSAGESETNQIQKFFHYAGSLIERSTSSGSTTTSITAELRTAIASVAIHRASLPPTLPGDDEYRSLVQQVRLAILAGTPPQTKLAVINKGDPDMLILPGRIGESFPQDADGSFAGFYPGDSAAAIAATQAAASRGITHLAVPATARWWFQQYPEWTQFLIAKAGNPVWQDPACTIFDLPR